MAKASQPALEKAVLTKAIEKAPLLGSYISPQLWSTCKVLTKTGTASSRQTYSNPEEPSQKRDFCWDRLIDESKLD